METFRQLKVHVSIQNGLSFPPLQSCNDCCPPNTYHCPFCSPTFFRPANYTTLREHLEIHLKKAVFIGKYTIHKCGLPCRNQPHYHCLYCASSLIRKIDFKNHLSSCHSGHGHRAKILSQLNTAATQRAQSEAPSLIPEGRDTPTSYYMETGSDCEDMTFSPDSDDQNSRGASSSYSATPTIPDNEYEAVGPDSSKCHRTVQTNFDKPQDCDEFYFMSLVKMFKKLSPQKKADVRMKIERLLFEAEFE